MAGSIIVRYAKKTYKQRRKENSVSHAQMKDKNYSIKSSTGAPERRKNDQDDYWFWVEYFNTFPENWY